MKGTLWGPPLWNMMFACTWSADASRLSDIEDLLLEQLPFLLPCVTCRANYRKHIPIVHQKTNGRPRTSDAYFKWCWYMKNEVNRTTKHPSLPLAELVERYVLHGAHVPEVPLADVLVLVAISARSLQQDDLFIDFCTTLSKLLPIPQDSAMRTLLTQIQRPIVNSALRCARNTRLQHGMRPLVLSHYRAVAT